METGGRLSPQHPFAPQFGVRPAVSLLDKEYLLSGPLGLLPQGGVLCHEGLPFLRIRLEQAFPGAFEGESQPVQVVETTAPAQANAPSLPDKPVNHLPVPVGQFNACRAGQLPHRPFQLIWLRRAEGGGEPPVGSNIRPAGPP